MTTLQDRFLVREEKIHKLERVAEALTEAARRCDGDRDRIRKAIEVAVSAECARCGVRLTGADLLALSQLPDPKEDPKIQQLRKGHCVRSQCESTAYKLIFENHADLNWEKLFSQRKAVETEEVSTAESAVEPETPAGPRPGRRLAIRMGILLGAVILLLLIRQWYYGGRIPFLREPEKFKVDPLPAGQTHE